MCTDLTNNPAPPGTEPATISPKLFIRWLEAYKCRVDNTNAKQVVAILFEVATVNNGGMKTPILKVGMMRGEGQQKM